MRKTPFKLILLLTFIVVMFNVNTVNTPEVYNDDTKTEECSENIWQIQDPWEQDYNTRMFMLLNRTEIP